VKKISIYLSGSIKKGKDDTTESLFWSDEDVKSIIENISGYDVEILNPATANIKRSNPLENFGADLYLVKKSDFLLVDLREKRGIGVGSEMTMAKYYHIPVISICPKESHYRRSKVEDVCGEDLYDWIHPFVLGLSDKIVENLKEAVDWINEYLKRPTYIKNLDKISYPIDKYQITLDDWRKIGIKDFGIIDESIHLYIEKQLSKSAKEDDKNGN
jgi:hypothetical protein